VFRRLEGRTISFEDAVVTAIARTAERQPRRIVEYAHDVYDKAALEGAAVATVAHFRQVFEKAHPLEVSEARALRDQNSPGQRATLRELSRHDGPMSPLELAKASYPEMRLPLGRQPRVQRDLPQGRVHVRRRAGVRVPQGPLHAPQRLALDL
jgi:hypothetical protein